MTAAAKTLVMLSDPGTPIDCDALLAFITAAQSLYAENCPIARPTMKQATKRAMKK